MPPTTRSWPIGSINPLTNTTKVYNGPLMVWEKRWKIDRNEARQGGKEGRNNSLGLVVWKGDASSDESDKLVTNGKAMGNL